MKSYVPSIGNYIKNSNLSRYDILAQLLESKNPAFVLNCILKRTSTETLKEYINNNASISYLINEAYNKGKLANGSGHGSLHTLAGIPDNEIIPDSEWEAIGYKISRMQDFNRRDYVGMINFLHVSCDMYTEIHKHLINLTKQSNNVNSGKEYELGSNRMLNEEYDFSNPNFYNSLNSIDDVTKLVAYALTKLKDVDCSDIEDEIKNGDMNMSDIDDYEYDDDDYEDEYDENGIVIPGGNGLEDGYGNQLTETRGYRGGNYRHHRGKGRNELVSMRHSRGNGKGGLKAFIGVPESNDLNYNDLKKIAVKIIQNSNPDECKQALDSVNYLGSACNSFVHLKSGYLNGIMNSRGKRFNAKNGYGKKSASKNMINQSTVKSKYKHKYRKP